MIQEQFTQGIKGTFNITAEKGVIGAMIMDSDVVEEIGRVLVSSDFCKPEHSVLFDAIIGLLTDGKPIDQITVFNRSISLNKELSYRGNVKV